MREYCGCQALAAIDLLTREHDTVVNLIGEVRAAHATADLAWMAELARASAGTDRWDGPVALGYFTLMESSRGQTLGKMLCF
jgi:hypothetical protein